MGCELIRGRAIQEGPNSPGGMMAAAYWRQSKCGSEPGWSKSGWLHTSGGGEPVTAIHKGTNPGKNSE